MVFLTGAVFFIIRLQLTSEYSVKTSYNVRAPISNLVKEIVSLLQLRYSTVGGL